MPKEFLLTAKHFHSTVASVRERMLAVFVVLCIIVNALMPRFAIDANDYSTLCQIMKSQSVLFEFFSFSTIPVKIVNELFNEQRNEMQPLAGKKSPKNDTSNASNTASDFSITASGFKDVSNRGYSQKGSAFGGNAVAVYRNYTGALQDDFASGAPPGIWFGLFAVLMFFFLRARSALPDAAAVIYNYAFSKPNSLLNWVFSLSITTSQRSLLCGPSQKN